MKCTAFRIVVAGTLLLASASYAEFPGAPPPLTDAQQDCIKSKGGNLPEEGPPPSAEIFAACGMEPPPAPPAEPEDPAD